MSKITKSAEIAAALTLLAACSSEPTPPAQSETAIAALDRQLKVAELAGPVVTKWAECPGGAGAVVLPATVRVVGYVFNGEKAPTYDDPERRVAAPIVTIHKATKYVEGKKTVAWCGESIGIQSKDYMETAPEGAIVVVPNLLPQCPAEIPDGEPIPVPQGCGRQSAEYDMAPGGDTSPSTVPLPPPAPETGSA